MPMESNKTFTSRARWTSQEETTLVQAVLDRESRLFGSMSGSGVVKCGKLKERAWEEVADVLNSQFFSEKRDAKECRKKYYNLKNKAKGKVDELKNPPTGGGPKTATFSIAETLLLEHIGERASVMGVHQAVDTDGPQSMSVVDPSCSQVADAIEPDMPGTGACFLTETSNEPADCLSNEFSTTAVSGKSSKVKNNKRQYQELAESTLLLDNKKMLLEMEVLKCKMEESKRHMQLMDREEEKIILEIDLLKQKQSLVEVKKELLSLKLKGITDFSLH